jgi:hypothetical protein
VKARSPILHHLYQRCAEGQMTQSYQHDEQFLCLVPSMTQSSWTRLAKLVAFPSWRRMQRVKAARLEESGFREDTLDGSEAGLGGVARCTRMMIVRTAEANGLTVPEEQRAMRGRRRMWVRCLETTSC